jgi:hypothetical protein
MCLSVECFIVIEAIRAHIQPDFGKYLWHILFSFMFQEWKMICNQTIYTKNFETPCKLIDIMTDNWK